MAYRISSHETTGATPFELMYGREAQLSEDLMFHFPATVDMHEHFPWRVLKSPKDTIGSCLQAGKGTCQ